MKRFKRIALGVPLSLIIFLGFCNSKNYSGNQKLLDAILNTLEKNHFNAVDLDDEFSEDVYNLYLERLDGGKRFFNKKDIEKFEKHKLQIDDQCKKRDLTFYNLVNETYSKRVEKLDKQIDGWLKKPLDFTSQESINLDVKKIQNPTSNKTYITRWKQNLKLAVLEKVARKMDAQENATEKKDTSFKYESFEKIEEDARKEVLKTHKEWFKRLKRMKERDRISIYLNCIANRFDPHTSYFPPKDKENFDINMSGRLEGIGATLSERDGYIKVERIVPGSPSYKQGELKSGDLILKVGQGEENPIDIVDMALDEAVQLIRGKKGTVVKLTVKKPEGTQKIIPITRDVVVIEEGYAKSAIIEQNGKKLGYLYLPQFYADFSRKGGPAAARDVKKELIKLQKEGVEGILFDLRNNGGGSLQEAIEIGGHFIPTAPIVQVKETDRKAQVYKDRDGNHSVYNGPLVVLVNSFSASASEIVAAALQDHNRAIIIGTKSTYGKGTVQTFANLDRFFAVSKDEPLGSLKLTIQKYYRITGGSTQLKGVVPDVILPDHYDSMNLGEKDQTHPLKYDKIEKTSFKLNPINLSYPIEKSKSRIANSPNFHAIGEYTMFNHKRSKNKTYSLNLDAYRAKAKKWKTDGELYKDVYKLDSNLNVYMLEVDKELLSKDSTKLNIKQDWINGLKKDLYIDESLNVLLDMIPLYALKE